MKSISNLTSNTKTMITTQNNMRSLSRALIMSYTLVLSLLILACSDDDNPPPQIDQEEVITTMIVTLTNNNTNQTIELRSQDLDGDGPETPTIEVSGNLSVASGYTGAIALLNETVSPAENIDQEVQAEGTEHQFFYTQGGGLNVSTQYLDIDNNGNPIGLAFALTTTAPGQGTITFTLRHEPLKPNDGSLSGAGGETDISVTFPVTVE
jgi:hypothetical protein